jgi:hypothetical protein
MFSHVQSRPATVTLKPPRRNRYATFPRKDGCEALLRARHHALEGERNFGRVPARPRPKHCTGGRTPRCSGTRRDTRAPRLKPGSPATTPNGRGDEAAGAGGVTRRGPYASNRQQAIGAAIGKCRVGGNDAITNRLRAAAAAGVLLSRRIIKRGASVIHPIFMLARDYAFQDADRKWGLMGEFQFVMLEKPGDPIPPFYLAVGLWL